MSRKRKYIGTKILLAEQKLAPESIGNIKAGTIAYEVTYPDGYISWSPADVFERAYREITDEELKCLAN